MPPRVRTDIVDVYIFRRFPGEALSKVEPYVLSPEKVGPCEVVMQGILGAPATLDLDTGLYYHGDPRHAHGPAGDVADLERVARGEGPPGPRGGNFYGAYFRDLDGNKFVAFHMGK